ncbi:MAG: sterol desaturase family protein, partial [Pseudomonadota bacterium]
MSLLISYKALIIALWFIGVFIAERLSRAARYPDWFSLKVLRSRLMSNISISAINVVLSPLLILPLTVFFSSQFYSWRPEWLQSPWMIIIDLIILDFFLYWW